MFEQIGSRETSGNSYLTNKLTTIYLCVVAVHWNNCLGCQLGFLMAMFRVFQAVLVEIKTVNKQHDDVILCFCLLISTLQCWFLESWILIYSVVYKMKLVSISCFLFSCQLSCKKEYHYAAWANRSSGRGGVRFHGPYKQTVQQAPGVFLWNAVLGERCATFYCFSLLIIFRNNYSKS